MKNTTFRKKALLSSVCMLLVALVALGSATFAWFSTKTSADAENVRVYTTQASSLVLSLDGQEWKSTIDLAIDKKLEPVSTKDLSAWYEATSTAYNAGTVDPATIKTASADNYIQKDFYIKSIGSNLDVDWLLTFAQGQKDADKDYMRAAMKIQGTDGTVMWWSNDSATTAAITGREEQTDGGNTTYTAKTENVTSSSATTGQLATLTKDTAYTVTLYVWFEGQDAQCIDDRAGTVCDFDLQFSKRAAAQG